MYSALPVIAVLYNGFLEGTKKYHFYSKEYASGAGNQSGICRNGFLATIPVLLLIELEKLLYTLDLTREYYNLLGLEDQATETKQAFFWDGNVAAMEEDGKPYYYLQDDLGSVTNLTGKNGESRERFLLVKKTGQIFTG